LQSSLYVKEMIPTLMTDDTEIRNLATYRTKAIMDYINSRVPIRTHPHLKQQFFKLDVVHAMYIQYQGIYRQK